MSEITESTEQDADNLQNMKKTLYDTKVNDNGVQKSVWKMTMETFGMAEGKTSESDILLSDVDEALSKLKSMIPETGDKWKFPVTPLKELDTTLDDILRCFVFWSNKVEEDEGEPVYNVNKAFRRLENYASWMYDHREDLTEPLTPESMAKPAKAWGMKFTHSEKTGHLMWFMDLGVIDLKAIQEELELKDSLRVFVWLSHIAILDPQAQKKGTMFIEGLAKLGMWESMTMIPMDLGTQLDRLTIGSLPLKMKSFYMFHASRWIHIFMGLMKPFLSQKMRNRLIVIPDAEDPEKTLFDLFGQECFPVDWAGLKGASQTDIVFGKYLKDVVENPEAETEC